MAKYTASIFFLANIKALKKGFKQAKRGFKDVGRFVQRNSRAMLGAATAGAAAFGGLVAQGVAYGTTIDRMAEATGIAHEEISRLTYASELYHGSAQDVEKAMKRLSKAMYDAGVRGLATYQDAFDELGIEIKNADGTIRSSIDVFMDFADAAAASTNATALLGGAQDLLGRSVMNLLPLMKQGSGAIREAFEESDRLGNTIDAKLSKQLEALGTNMKRIKLAGRGVGAVLAADVAPAVEKMVDKLLDAVAAFQELSPEMKTAAIATGGFSIAGLGMLGFLGLAWEPLKGLVRLVKKIPAVFGVAAVAFGVLETGAQLAAGEFEKANDRVLELLVSSGEFSRSEFAKASFWAMLVAGIRGMGGGIAGTLAQLELFYARLAAPPEMIGPPVAPAFIGPMPAGAVGPTDEELAAMQALADAEAAAAEEARLAEAPLLRMGAATYELETRAIGLLGAAGPLPAVIGDVTSSLEGQLGPIGDLRTGWEVLTDYLANSAAPSFEHYIDVLGSAMDVFSTKKMKWFDQVKKGTKKFLGDILKMHARQAALDMAITVSKETGKATMSGQWWLLPIIAAGYAAAVAGINAATGSFDVGAKVVRGGAFTGTLDTGERLVNLRDFKQLIAAGSGGRNVTVNVTVGMEGMLLDSTDVDDRFRGLADYIARRIDRE